MREMLFACSLALFVGGSGVVSADAEPRPMPPVPAPAPDAEPGEGPQQYVFQLGLYRLNQPGDADAVGIRHFPERHPPTSVTALGVPHTFGTLQCEQCHAGTWPRGQDGLPATVADRVIGEALTASVAQVIAEPVLSTVEGRPAQLRLQGGEVEYFVREANGQFRLEKMQDQTGVEVHLRVSGTKAENDTRTVTVDPFEIKITTLDRREPVDGVALPVGKPVFRTFEWDATLTCRPGQLNAFTLDSPRQGRILVVVRLEMPGEEPHQRAAQRTSAEAADETAKGMN
jgi:hypothetical protein